MRKCSQCGELHEEPVDCWEAFGVDPVADLHEMERERRVEPILAQGGVWHSDIRCYAVERDGRTLLFDGDGRA